MVKKLECICGETEREYYADYLEHAITKPYMLRVWHYRPTPGMVGIGEFETEEDLISGAKEATRRGEGVRFYQECVDKVRERKGKEEDLGDIAVCAREAVNKSKDVKCDCKFK